MREVESVQDAPEPERVAVCVNDCVLFHRVHPADGGRRAAERLDLATVCPQCAEPRYVQGTHRERRVFWRFTMVDMFRNLFARAEFAAVVPCAERRTDGVVEARARAGTHTRAHRLTPVHMHAHHRTDACPITTRQPACRPHHCRTCATRTRTRALSTVILSWLPMRGTAPWCCPLTASLQCKHALHAMRPDRHSQPNRAA